MTQRVCVLRDTSGNSGTVQALVLIGVLGLGGIAAVRLLGQALGDRADCAANDIRTLSRGGCGQGGGVLAASLIVPPAPSAAPRGGQDDQRGGEGEARGQGDGRGGEGERREGEDEGGGGPSFFDLPSPGLDLPDVDLPDVDLPDVDLPDVDLPDVDLPDVDLPDVDVPSPGEIIDQGRETTGDIIDRGRDFIDDTRERVGNTIDDIGEFIDIVTNLPERVSEQVQDLEPGDSLTVGLEGSISAGPAISASANLVVTRQEDGSFVVAVSGDVLVGLGLFENDISVGPGATAEFRFDTPAEAQAAVETLVAAAQAAPQVALPGGAPRAVDEFAGLAELRDDLSAVEVRGEAAAGVGERIGISGFAGGGADASVSASLGARFEFEEGELDGIAVFSEVSGRAAADQTNSANGFILEQPAVADAFEDVLGFDPRTDSGSVAASVEAGFTVEARAEVIEGRDIGIPSPDDLGNIMLGETTGSVRGTVTGELNDRGVQANVEVGNITRDGVFDLFEDLAEGRDLASAFADSGTTITGSVDQFEDDGLDLSVNIPGVSAGIENTIRDVTETRPFGIVPDADGTGLDVVVEEPRPPGTAGLRAARSSS